MNLFISTLTLAVTLTSLISQTSTAQLPDHERPKQPAQAKLKPWPSILKGAGHAKVLMPESTTPPFIYITRSYRFISQTKLNKTKISKLAATAESVASALQRIPLELSAPPLTLTTSKPAIYLYPDETSYSKAGGPAASAGYYSGKDNAILLRADKFIETNQPNYQLLIHELVHLNMDSILAYCNAWFSEGNAEYITCAFYGTSSYKFNDMTRSIKLRVRQFYSTNETITLPPLKQLIELDFKQWNDLNETLEPTERYAPYLASLLIVHYFYHIAPNGRENIQRYLTAVHHRSAHQQPNPLDQAHLFPASELANIQSTIIAYWKKRGLSVQFK